MSAITKLQDSGYKMIDGMMQRIEPEVHEAGRRGNLGFVSEKLISAEETLIRTARLLSEAYFTESHLAYVSNQPEVMKNVVARDQDFFAKHHTTIDSLREQYLVQRRTA